MDKKNNINNDFWQLSYKDEEMAKKYQEFDKSLAKIKEDVSNSCGSESDRIICIFAVYFWNKGKDIENKEKAKQIDSMIRALDTDLSKYTTSNMGSKIKAQIDVVNSIEKILGAFISINPELFKIKQFDGVLKLTPEKYTEFYSVIWAASQETVQSIIDKYRDFLQNNKTASNDVSKMNLALSEDDLKQVKARIDEISKLKDYIHLLDSMFSDNNFQELQKSMNVKNKTLQDILKYETDKCKQEKEECKKDETMRTLYESLISIKNNIGSVTDSFKNLQNLPEENIKNNLTDKISWNDDLDRDIYSHTNTKGGHFSETYKQFFEIKKITDINTVKEYFDNYHNVFMQESVFLNKDNFLNVIIKAFNSVISNLDCNDKETQKAFENKYLKDKYIKVAMFAVNTLHKNDDIDEIEKTKESMDIIKALEVNKDSAPVDLNNAANDIEKILLAFAKLDIDKFNIKKFDDLLDFITDESKFSNLVKLQDAAMASQSAYKFIEKYQEFLDYNAGQDNEIKKINERFNKKDAAYQNNPTNKKDLQSEIQGYENTKINLALNRESLGKIKKIIDKIFGFAKCMDIVYSIFDSNSFSLLQEEWNKIKDNHEKNGDIYKDHSFKDFLNELLTSIDFHADYNALLKDSPKLQYVYKFIMIAKKNMFDMLLDPKQLKIEKKTIDDLENKVKESEKVNKEKRDERIKNIYEKLAEDTFNKNHKDWGYDKCNREFIQKGREEAKKKIESSETNMIAGEFIEDEEKNIDKRIKDNEKQIESNKKNNESTKSLKEVLKKLNTKLDRIRKFKESKGKDSNGYVPTIFVKDEYFYDQYADLTNENLYKDEPMSNFDDKGNLLTGQKKHTCYCMSILIGLIEQGMGSYIQKHIIRDYNPDTNGKTNKAVVRLFDENGCPVDFVVDKSKLKYDDDRPLWICVLEKAMSVMMNKTAFKSRRTSEILGNLYGNGASIIQGVDWNELEKKQKPKNKENMPENKEDIKENITENKENIKENITENKEDIKENMPENEKNINEKNIFKAGAFSINDIADATESTGIQMILGKTCFKKCTGKLGRKIEYAKEGDETLGFIAEALDQGKLVIGSTYYDSGTEIPVRKGSHDSVKFDSNFCIPQEHVVFFKSIDLEKGQITTIDSIRGKQTISFADFKRHFSDIHVTDFPQEAERLKEQEQSEKLPKEVDKNITILNDAKNSIQNFEQTWKAIKDKKDNIEEGIKNLTSKIKNNKEELEAQTENSIKSINDKIKQFTTTMDRLKNDIQQHSGIPINLKNSLDQINDDIRNIQTDANKLYTETGNYFDKMTQQPSQILDSYYKIVDDVQQPNQKINENIDIISDDLQRMNNAIQQKNYNQLLDDKTTLRSIKQRIQELQKSKIALAKDIESKANQLNGDIQQFTTTRTDNIESLKRQKTGLQESINKTNSNLKQLTGKDSDFKKLDNFITTERKYKADLAEQINKGIDNIENENKTLKAATDENVEKMNAELDNVNSQKESYHQQITEWESILDTLESAKKNLAKLKDNKQITPQLTKKIDDNLAELNDIKNTFENKIKTQIDKENKTLAEKHDIIDNQKSQIDSFKTLQKDFENRMNECAGTLNNEQNELKTIDEQIEKLNNDKTNFEESMQENTKTLKNEQNKLETIDQQIKKLEDNKKEFEESMQKNTKTLEDKQNELNEIDEQIKQLNKTCEQLEKTIQQAIAEKYNLTSNKIKKCGIGVSVVGGVGTISVLVIPSVNIVFIAVPSPFALLGIILVGIYLYRNNKKPPREAIIITGQGDDNGKKSITETIKEVVEKDKNVVEKGQSVDDQKLNNNENIITTKSDI